MNTGAHPTLSPSDLAVLRDRLHGDVERLRDRVAELTVYRPVDDDRVPDSGDAATARDDEDEHHRLIIRHQAALHRSEAALRRLDEGRFGTCCGCGGGIEPERLRTVPTATMCLSCMREPR